MRCLAGCKAERLLQTVIGNKTAPGERTCTCAWSGVPADCSAWHPSHSQPRGPSPLRGQSAASRAAETSWTRVRRTCRAPTGMQALSGQSTIERRCRNTCAIAECMHAYDEWLRGARPLGPACCRSAQRVPLAPLQSGPCHCGARPALMGAAAEPGCKPHGSRSTIGNAPGGAARPEGRMAAPC